MSEQMKKIIYLGFFIALINLSSALAQVIITLPKYSTENDSITVVFNAVLGDAGLKNYSGNVYAYTGVITNYSTDSHDWKHVIGTWSSYQTLPIMTLVNPNIYKLVIGNPRKYYGLTDPNEHILELAFVFRSADGNTTGRDVGGADIFAQLYPPGISLKLNSPVLSTQYDDPMRSPVFTGANDTVNISVSGVALGTQISSINLFVNNTLQDTTSTDSLFYSFIASNHQTGTNNITIIGHDTAGITDTLSFAIVNNPPVDKQPLPAGNELGINYNDNTSVTLALFAPYKSFVYVLGDFNDWKVDSAYYMKEQEVTPDSVIWWITIKNLSPGTEYAFQYLVDGNLRIADPFTEKILDPNNDSYINSSPPGNIVYPNLKPYPTGNTSEIVSVLQTGQTNYNWQVPNFKRPAKTDLVIYELLIRDFVSTHSYHTLIDTIAYLKRLGVNAIELMPVMEFDGNDSWGYNPSFDFAPDKYYGPKDSLKRFVDIAHMNGIAVILDAPMNDITGTSPLARLYWDNVNNQPAADNPWLNPVATHPYNVFNDFNYSSPAMKYYISRFTRFWLSNYNIDGFRFDLAGGYTQAPNGSGNWESVYDPTRVATDKTIADSMWSVSPNSYVILEEFVTNAEEDTVANYGLMVWDNMSGSYQQASMGYPSGPPGTWDLSGISYKKWGWSIPGLVGYMESHDEERLMYKNEQYGNSNGSYNIKNLVTGLNRIKLCETLFYTIPGPKMLWQFGELGYDISINYNGRIGAKPILWNYYSDPNRLSLYKYTKALIDLKTNNDVFNTTSFSTNLTGSVKSVVLNGSQMNLVAVGNFDVVSQNASTSAFPYTGTWYDYFSGNPVNITSSPIPLAPGESHIYTSKQLPVPDTAVITGINEFNNSIVKTYNLEQNYPNPFNPATTINYQIPKSSLVTLKVYDILGREVATLVNKEEMSGKYSVSFDASKFSSGVYFYKIQAGNFISLKKMILLK